MDKQSLSAHEIMEIHELLNFKTLCLAKSKLMQGLVFDQDLKALMNQDVQQSILAVNELRGLYPKVQTQQAEVYNR